MNQETVFTNNENGKLLQKAWINENIKEIAELIDKHDEKVDFILVTPDGVKNAAVSFFNTKQLYQTKLFSKRDKQPIIDWMKSHNSRGFLSVIFINKKGRISFYDVPVDLMTKYDCQVLVA